MSLGEWKAASRPQSRRSSASHHPFPQRPPSSPAASPPASHAARLQEGRPGPGAEGGGERGAQGQELGRGPAVGWSVHEHGRVQAMGRGLPVERRAAPTAACCRSRPQEITSTESLELVKMLLKVSIYHVSCSLTAAPHASLHPLAPPGTARAVQHKRPPSRAVRRSAICAASFQMTTTRQLT